MLVGTIEAFRFLLTCRKRESYGWKKSVCTHWIGMYFYLL